MAKFVGGRLRLTVPLPSVTGRSRAPNGIETQYGQFIRSARNPTIIQPPLAKSIFCTLLFPNNCKQIE
jgi:hypothetical protein